MRKVMICTPMYNSQATAQYTISMINLMAQAHHYRDELEVTTLFALNESLIHKTRNLLTHSFLKSDCTHLLFIDADVGFEAHQIIKMMLTEEDIVCGIYPKKSIKWDKVISAVKAGVPEQELPKHSLEYLFIPSTEQIENGLVEIERAGTGMMLISRNAFESLTDKVDSFKLEANLENVFQVNEDIAEYFFTSVDRDTKVYLHEDFNFCKLWLESGGKIYAAPWVELTHSGTHVYGL